MLPNLIQSLDLCLFTSQNFHLSHTQVSCYHLQGLEEKILMMRSVSFSFNYPTQEESKKDEMKTEESENFKEMAKSFRLDKSLYLEYFGH